MNSHRFSLFLLGRRLTRAFVTLGVIVFAAPLHAFPPAPYYIIFGTVRDEMGATLSVSNATIILLRDNAEIGRAAVWSDLRPDRNYQLTIPIDQNRPASRIYAHGAVAAQGVYSLIVEINGVKFYPIEVKGTLRAGNGGEEVRLDLNLGADSDGDGLPDAWEQWQLYKAGRSGASLTDLSLITREGDFDGDGINNYHEYVAGTFAGDARERFELRIRGKTATQVEFEFFTITGKVYSIEESSDLKKWQVVPFSTSRDGTPARLFQARAVGVTPAYAAVPRTSNRFYRLSVR